MSLWAVYRLTPTEEVWACMSHAVEAETGLDAISAVAAEHAGSSHLQGWHFAVPADAHVFAFTRSHTEHVHNIEIEERLPRTRQEVPA